MAEIALHTILDLPVMASDDVHLGDVVDILISVPEQRVVALVVEWVGGREQIQGPGDVLPLSQVAQFDPHQLVVHSEYAETAGLDFDPYEEGGMVLASSFLDREVQTRSGRSLGILADVFFDEVDGAVLGYEVDREETALPAHVIGPCSDLEILSERIVVPDRFSLVALAKLQEIAEEEEAEPQEFVFEGSLAERSTEEPDLLEENESDNRA